MKPLKTLAGVATLLCLSALSPQAATLTNWARAGIASQSTTYAPQGAADRAIDGNTLGGWSDATTSHTADSENTADGQPWWQVDLQAARTISHLHFWFREDCCFARNDNLRIVIFDSPNVATRKVLWETNNVALTGMVPRDLGYDVTPAVNGQVVYVEHLPQQDTDNYVSLTEVEVFNQPLTAVTNYALTGTATSTSCYTSNCDLYGPQQAIDGIHHTWTSVTSPAWPYAYSAPDNTAGVDPLPWWQLDLAAAQTVGSVAIWGRHDRTYARYSNIRLTVADQSKKALYEQMFTIQPTGQVFVVNFVPPLANAKIVKLETTDTTPDKFLNLPEVEVFAPLPTAPTLTFTTNLRSITLNENLVPTFGPVEVTVDGGIRPEAISYRWFRNGVEIPGLAGNWLKSYTTPSRVGPSSNGDKYKVQASVSGYGVFSDEVVLTVTADTIVPVLQYAAGNNTFNKVRVWFSESLDSASAQTAANYKLSGGLTVTSATLSAPAGSPGDNIVDLVTSAQTPGQIYTLTVTGVKDQSAAANVVAAGSTAQFTAWTLASGYLTFEHWDNMPGAADTDIDTALADPRVTGGQPTTASLLIGRLDTRTVFPDDTHENYLSRTTGWITPTESGSYYFFLASDDASRLYLSTNETPPNPATDTPIANEPGCCNGFYEPDAGDPSTTAAPIALQAGKRYSVLVLHKEGGGGDWMKVAWRKSTDTTAAASLAPIPGQFLSTFVDPSADLKFTKQPTDQVGVLPSAGVPILTQDFKTTDGGFTVKDTDPAVPGPWVYDSASGSWMADGSADPCGGPFNSQLSSPAYKLTQDGTVSVSFTHRYSFEAVLFDAGILRVSVNGGAFNSVPADNFTANGYAQGNIVGNGIALGQRGFNANSPGYKEGSFITSQASLGTFSKNDTIAVQFLGAWDECSGADHPSWQIKGYQFEILPMIIQDFAKSDGGFKVENTTPAPPGPFVYVSTNGVWQAGGSDDACGGPFNSKLTSPAYVVTQNDEVTLNFSHRYSFEDGLFDAGQVRISVNGGAFNPVPAASFSANGYAPGAVAGNGILNGQNGFNGNSPGFTNGTFITSSAVLGTFSQNDTIAVQFVGAWDECSGQLKPSWAIKNVQLAFGKAARFTTFDGLAEASMRGAPLTVNYQWQRKDSTAFVDIAGATAPTFQIYPTAADFAATFQLVATVIGKSLASNPVKIVTATADAPTIGIASHSGNTTITFTGKLQSAAKVSGPYSEVPGATSPYAVPSSTGSAFFRSAK